MRSAPDQIPYLRNVHRYFDSTAASFDSIYSSPRLVDRIFRRDMYDRFRRTLAECEPVTDKSVLDIGCGSGQYAIMLAARGAREVIGLDFAQSMLAIAEDKAQRAGVSDRCRFVAGEFLSSRFDRPFDYLIAVGFFDYIKDPSPFLVKAAGLTREKLIATFPRRLTWRAPVRKVRLRLQRCPVFFSSRPRVEALMRQAGFTVAKLEVCGNIYWVVATPTFPPSATPPATR